MPTVLVYMACYDYHTTISPQDDSRKRKSGVLNDDGDVSSEEELPDDIKFVV